MKEFTLRIVFLFLLAANSEIYSQPPQYNLSVKISPEIQRIEAAGTLRLPAVNFTRDSLELSLSELMEDFRAEIISPAGSAGVAKLDKKARPNERPGWGTVTWTIHPAHPIPANEPVLLKFSYSGGGGSERSSFVFSLGKEVCFGSGLNTAWYPEVEEFPVKSDGRLRGLRSTGTLIFTVPRGYAVHAQGMERNISKETAQGSFRFEINNPVFFSFAAAKYTVRRQSSGLPIALYLLRPRETAGNYINGSAKILKALTGEFGAYPHTQFAVVEVPTKQAEQAGFGGASVDGFIMASTEFLDKDFNTAYFGHEISHQWWGNLVRTKAGASEGLWMLSEGMAQYGSLRAVEILEGEKAAAQYRRTGYPGYAEDQNARGYFTLIDQGKDYPLFNLPLSDGASSRTISDSKGAIVLDMLSRRIGRQRLNLILQNFLRKNAYRRVEWNDFRRAVETGASENLRWFFEQWFERTGAPDYQLTWKQEGKNIHGEITQSLPYFRARLDVEIKGADRQLLKTVEITDGRAVFNWSLPFKANSIILDPEYKVLRRLPEFQKK